MDQQYGPGTGGFGLVSAGTIGSPVLLAWVAIWVARRGRLLRGLWERVSNAAVIGQTLTWVRDRISDRGRALARRLPASEVAGVALLLGLVVVVALAVGFTEVLDDVLEGDGIVGIDHPVTRWLAAHRDLWLTTVLRAVTNAGGPLFLAALALPISVAAGWRCRSWRPVVLALVCGGGVPLVLFTAKALVGRNRPPLPFALFSRVYLGVHYVSDVLSGWMLGMAWAGTVMLAGTWWDNTRRARGRQPEV